MGDIGIKVGDSLLLTLTFFNDDGSGVDLTNVVLSSQVRTPDGTLVATLTITPTIVLNVATVTVPDTSLWPPGLLRADIKAVSGGLTVLSETFGIRVNRTTTR